jgi:hypothetical protein
MPPGAFLGIAAALPAQRAGNSRLDKLSPGAAAGADLLQLVKGDRGESRGETWGNSSSTLATSPGLKVWELEATRASASHWHMPDVNREIQDDHFQKLLEASSSRGYHPEPATGARRGVEPFDEEGFSYWRTFEKRVKVSIQPDGGWLRVQLTHAFLEDRHVHLLARYLDDLLRNPEVIPLDLPLWCSLELDQNNVGDEGFIELLDVLEEHSVSCKHIKLYKNRLTDSGGIRLAEMIWRQQYPADEIHLSHNGFTAHTLVAMCMAMDANDAYPILIAKQQKYAPCWLRIEQNSIDRPLEVVDLIQREANLRICLAHNHDLCKATRCQQGSHRWQDTPLLHLVIVHKQREPTAVSDDEVRTAISQWRASSIANTRPFSKPSRTRGRTSETHTKAPQVDELHQASLTVDFGMVDAQDRQQPIAADEAKIDPVQLQIQERALAALAESAKRRSEWADSEALEAQQKARKQQVEAAIEIISAVNPGDDTDVFEKWKEHIEQAAEPEVEANRILRMMRHLHKLGYLGPALPMRGPASAPHITQQVPLPQPTSGHLASMRFPGRTPEPQGSGSRPLLATHGIHPSVAVHTGPRPVQPLLSTAGDRPLLSTGGDRPILSTNGDVPRTPPRHPNGNSTDDEPDRESPNQTLLLGLLQQLQSSPSSSRPPSGQKLTSDTALEGLSAEVEQAVGSDLQSLAGECEKKKKGKNKIGASARQSEPGNETSDVT